MNYTAVAIEPIEVILNEEAEDYRWLSRAEAARLALNRPTRILLDLTAPRRYRPDSIYLQELEVRYHVGVPEEERAHPQRLLLNLELKLDISRAAKGDSLSETVNYHDVAQRQEAL